MSGVETALHAAGRTDAGAHAEGQVVNFRYGGRLPVSRIPAALNARLPADAVVLAADEVPPDFHARYSARWRRYRYRYLDRAARPALDRGRCWHVRRELDVEAMVGAAAPLVGRHDWMTFCAASEPAASRVRVMRDARVGRHGRFVDLELVGEGFLRGLVRGLAGALAEVGLRRRRPEWVAEVLVLRDRRLAARTAPAAGLTLVGVEY